MPTKCCSKCGITKELTEFYASKKGRLGRRPSCKLCDRVYEVNRPDRSEYHREWREKNRHKESYRLGNKARKQKRRAMELALPGSITGSQLTEIYERWRLDA